MRIWTFLIMAVLLTACIDQPYSSATLRNEDGFWSQDDNLKMSFQISDTTEIYDLRLSVEHSLEYAWENLYIRINNRFPDGDTLRQVVSLDLANKKGEWQGDCGGGHCKADIDLQSSFFFPQQGEYEIWVEQFMRVPNVEGIESIDLALYTTAAAD